MNDATLTALLGLVDEWLLEAANMADLDHGASDTYAECAERLASVLKPLNPATTESGQESRTYYVDSGDYLGADSDEASEIARSAPSVVRVTLGATDIPNGPQNGSELAD